MRCRDKLQFPRWLQGSPAICTLPALTRIMEQRFEHGSGAKTSAVQCDHKATPAMMPGQRGF